MPNLTAVKDAVLVATSVAVLCPHCDEPMAAPHNFSEMWTGEDFSKAAKIMECFYCHEKVRIHSGRRRIRFS